MLLLSLVVFRLQFLVLSVWVCFNVFRVAKVAKRFADGNKKIHFAVSSVDLSHELSEFGLTFSADKPVVTAWDSADQKYAMSAEFR